MKIMISNSIKRYNYLVGETGAAYHSLALKLRLSDSIMQILYTICDYEGNCRLKDICRLTGLAKQTVNSAIRKLENDGIVRLEAVNSKSKKVILTEQGVTFAEKTVAKIIQAENEIFDSWSSDDVAQYLALTERYLIAMNKKVEVIEKNE